MEKLDDRNQSTGEFLRALGDIPSITIDDTDIENELNKLKISDNNPHVPLHDTPHHIPLELPIAPTNPLIYSPNTKVEKQLILD